MPKPTKVVPIRKGQSDRLIAADEIVHRVIFSIGGERFAIDLFGRISQLPPPSTADLPANVLPLKKR